MAVLVLTEIVGVILFLDGRRLENPTRHKLFKACLLCSFFQLQWGVERNAATKIAQLPATPCPRKMSMCESITMAGQLNTRTQLPEMNITFTPTRVNGKFQCFCMRPAHARYSFSILRELVYNHEDNSMEGLYPDPDFGSSSVETHPVVEHNAMEVDIAHDAEMADSEAPVEEATEEPGRVESFVVEDQVENAEDRVEDDEMGTSELDTFDEDCEDEYGPAKIPFQERRFVTYCDTLLDDNVETRFIYENLVQLGIFYDRDLGIVICPSERCKSPVRHDHVWSHYWNKGHWTPGFIPAPPTRSVLIAWLEKAGLNKNPQTLVGRSVSLPRGVGVVEKAYKCTLPVCYATSRIFSTRSRFQTHHRQAEHHPGGVQKLENRPFVHVRAFALSLFNKDRFYVEIANSTDALYDIRVERIVKAPQLEDEKRRAVGMFKKLEDDRQAREWVYFAGWHTELENNSLPALQALISLPSKGSPEARLLPVVRSYLEKGNKDVSKLAPDVRSDLGNTGKYIDESLRVMHTEDSVQKRSRALASLLLMFLRLARNPIPTYPSYLDSVHVEALSQFGAVLCNSSSTDSEIKDAVHSTSLVLTQNTPTSQLKRVNESLFLRFELIRSLRQDGSFIKATEVTHNIAALRWSLRAVYAIEFWNLKDRLPVEESRREFEMWMKYCHPYIAPTGERTFFTSMDMTMKAMSYYAAGEAEPPNTIWDLEGRRVTVNKVTVDVEQFKKGLCSSIADVQEKINQLLPKELVTKLHGRVFTLLSSHKDSLAMIAYLYGIVSPMGEKLPRSVISSI
ncbi:hypothetical protein DL96DRAFT_1557551 [Flagelloscypha sp. PMI_526]|nr:hypothetical protein DL96DRAFT_1557551 [Flagelloscypha sp. PMI_526]